MDRMIFVNLPVADVGASRRFYTGLGFGVNERFSDDDVACVVISSQIVVMLLEQSRFAELVTTQISDSRTTTPVLNCLSAEGRQEVDELVSRAVANGGTARAPVEDGELYGRSFTDPDGHVWEVLHVEVPTGHPTDAAAAP